MRRIHARNSQRYLLVKRDSLLIVAQLKVELSKKLICLKVHTHTLVLMKYQRIK